MSNSLHDVMADVLRGYVNARSTERIGRSSATWRSIMSIPGLLASTETVRRHPALVTRASAGQGSWARIPWVALLDARVTSTTRSGTYVIYLFCADMTGFYLTINQGVTEPLARLGLSQGLAWVRERAIAMRASVEDLTARGFALHEPLDLHSDYATAQHYAASTIAHRFYAAAGVPDDAELLEDLDCAITACDRIACAADVRRR